MMRVTRVTVDLSMDCFEETDGTKHQKEADQTRQSHAIPCVTAEVLKPRNLTRLTAEAGPN